MFINEGFIPDYHNLEDAAYNRPAKRLPLYEHAVTPSFIERVMGEPLAELWRDARAHVKRLCEFYRMMGYDTVSIEGGVSDILPGGGALAGHQDGVIQNREDFDKYPWGDLTELYFGRFEPMLKALRDEMPEGMKAVGGVGYGVFETVQDLTGYMNLCYIKYDDPELYAELFARVGGALSEIWSELLRLYPDVFCVCRFGDDLGFKSTTLLPADDVKSLIIPQYKRIIDAVHRAGKPFLLHSCGQIFDVFEYIISEAGIDAKHSNEDVIAPFSEWVERYGDRIGNFGGIDTDVICGDNPDFVREYTLRVLNEVASKPGIAIGSGNSVPAYANPESYFAMNETIRKFRGE